MTSFAIACTYQGQIIANIHLLALTDVISMEIEEMVFAVACPGWSANTVRFDSGFMKFSHYSYNDKKSHKSMLEEAL